MDSEMGTSDNQDENRELHQVIQIKKEKFRVQIRASKNKKLLQMKRLKLSNDNSEQNQGLHGHTENIQYIEKGEENSDYFQKFKESISFLARLDQNSQKQDVLVVLKQIDDYLKQGAFYQDVLELIPILPQITLILMITTKEEIDNLLIQNALLVLINSSYFCDSMQILPFETPDILNSLLRLMFSEEVAIRENCLSAIKNIISEGDQTVNYFMKEHFPQQILTLLTTYGVSDKMCVEISTTIDLIVGRSFIQYPEGSEFLVPLDELTDRIISSCSGTLNEDEIETLKYVSDAVSKILQLKQNIETNEETVLENFVIEFPRMVCYLIDLVPLIGFSAQELTLSVTSLFGLLLSGNIQTTKILMDNGIFNIIKHSIKHPDEEIRKESVWSLSNLLVFTTIDGLDDILKDTMFWEDLMNLALTEGQDVRKWSYVSILNALALEDMEFTELILQQLTESDLLKFIFTNILSTKYQDVIVSFLSSLSSLITYGEYVQSQNEYRENHIIVLIKRMKSQPILEEILQKTYDSDIAGMSSLVLEKIN